MQTQKGTLCHLPRGHRPPAASPLSLPLVPPPPGSHSHSAHPLSIPARKPEIWPQRPMHQGQQERGCKPEEMPVSQGAQSGRRVARGEEGKVLVTDTDGGGRLPSGVGAGSAGPRGPREQAAVRLRKTEPAPWWTPGC